MTTVLEFARRCESFAGDLRGVEKTATGKAALAVKTVTLAEMRTVAPTLKLSGVGKRGAKIGVSYTVGGSTAIVRATGPVQLIESDTKAHRMPRTRVRGKRRVVVIPGVGVRSSAQHPGTKGQHPWRKGVEAARPLVGAVFAEQLGVSMRKVFGR